VDFTPLFLTPEDICEYHSEQIRLYGGLDGIRDSDLLDSALGCPKNLYERDEPFSLCDIATAYAFHISENQAFNDGNKRTGLQAAIAFLKVNGYAVETSEEHLFQWMISLADRSMSRHTFSDKLCSCCVRERGLTTWIRTLFPV
jgi:death-on-curing protein